MLVNYSSSSSEDENEVVSPYRKRQKLNVNAKDVSPAGGKMRGNVTRVVSAEKSEGSCQDSVYRLPLPASVMEMFRDSEEQHIDDHCQHGGRIRSFQHERGNWATYVYLPYNETVPDEQAKGDGDSGKEKLPEMAIGRNLERNQTQQGTHPHLDEPEDVFLELLDGLRVHAAAHGVTLTPAEEFHISLSRTVVLRHHWIQPFVQSLRSELATCTGFVCLADKLKVYANPEKTRTFLGMEISTGHMQLLEVVKRVDKLMEEFNLSTYYEDPSFHLSLAWCVGDFAEKLQHECLSELQSLVDGHEDGPFQMKLNCKELHCKTGNKFYRFPLQ